LTEPKKSLIKTA